MANYTISYNSVNTYSSKIHEALLEFLVIPSTYDGYLLQDFNISSTPRLKFYLSKNLNGFQIIKYRITQPLTQFEFNFKANVSMGKRNIQIDAIDFTNMSGWIALQTHGFKINHLNYLQQSFYTKLSKDDIQLPLPNYNKPILTYCINIMQFVYQIIEFKDGVTDTTTTVSDVLKTRQGVCQDFTHLYIAIMRNAGLPARYVSGYLNQGSEYKGSAYMHAWAEVMIPNVGWTGFDPTNNTMVDNNYLKVSHGLDYSECGTLKGIVRSNGTNKTKYAVQVVEQ